LYVKQNFVNGVHAPARLGSRLVPVIVVANLPIALSSYHDHETLSINGALLS